MLLENGLGFQFEALQGTPGHVVHPDVRFVEKSVQRSASLGPPEVEGQAALAAVQQHEIGTLAGDVGVPAPGEVPQGWLLDLDHVGAPVRQDPRTEGSRHRSVEPYDTQVLEHSG